jgi:hypothetical protein
MVSPRRGEPSKKAMMILHKVLADAELQAPAGAQGAFIPVGNSFDAFTALTKVLGGATQDKYQRALGYVSLPRVG